MTRGEEPEFYAIAPRSYKAGEEKTGEPRYSLSPKKENPGR